MNKTDTEANTNTNKSTQVISIELQSELKQSHPEISKKGMGASPLSYNFHKACLRVTPFALVFLASIFLYFADLGKYPLFNPDEALYAEPAKEMLIIGDYITTYLNYVVRFTKPPLAIWGQALGIVLFGCNEFAVRFLGASCAAILVACTYWFAEKFAGRFVAIASSLILATAPLYIGTAREAITDMPLTLFVASAMMSFYAGRKLQEKKYIYLAYVLTSLAVMTKGPVGLVLPLLILVAYHILRTDLFKVIKQYHLLPGIVIVSLISLPWFIIEIAITKGAYFNEFIMRENFARFTSVVDSHKGAWWYHVAAVFGGLLPWSFYLPQALFGAARPLILFQNVNAEYKGFELSKKDSHFLNKISKFKMFIAQSLSKTYAANSEKDELAFYCLIWSVLTVAFFSFSVSKLLPYTLPAFPALALLIALEFEKIQNITTRMTHSLNRRAVLPALAIVILYFVVTFFVPSIMNKLREAPSGLAQLIISMASFELTFAIVATVILSRGFLKTAFYVFFIPTFMGLLFFGSRLLTTLSQTWEEPLPAMANFAGLSKLPIVVYDMRKPSVPFYAGRKVLQPGSEEALKKILFDNEASYILSKSKRSKYFESMPGARVIYKEGKFILVYFSKEEALALSNSQVY